MSFRGRNKLNQVKEHVDSARADLEALRVKLAARPSRELDSAWLAVRETLHKLDQASALLGG